MARHVFAPTERLVVTPKAEPTAHLPVVAIAWDDEHLPDDNDLRELDYLVLIPGAMRPSWVLGMEVTSVAMAA